MSTNDINDYQLIQKQDEQLQKQYKFRNFRSEIVSVLQLFEKSKEWADLIKCLKQLIQVLTKYQNIPLIPEKLTLSKRLAQCLNPNLPTGVHLKVLEVYGQILQHIGDQRLAIDIAVWSSGLFAFLPHASLQAKPFALDLLERFYLPLPVSALIPCISAFVLAILSSFEEGSSEIANRAKNTMEKLVNKMECEDRVLYLEIFYECLWRTVLLTSQFRIAAFNFISYLIKKKKAENNDKFPEEIIAKDTSLVVSSILLALSDSSVLVQRATFELLITHFTFDVNVLPRKQYVILLQNSLMLLCKKDMSINRRIFQWLFGNTAAEFDANYFSKYSLSILMGALSYMLSSSNTYEESSAPLTVIFLLLQSDFPLEFQSQIAGTIIENILYYLHKHLQGKNSEKVVNTFLQLLSILEPKSIVWDCLISMMKKTNSIFDPKTTIHDNKFLDLIDLVGAIFSILYSEKLESTLLITLEVELLKFLHLEIKSQYPNAQIIETCLLLCITVFTKIPSSVEHYSVVGQIYAKVERIFGHFVNNIIMPNKKEEQPEQETIPNEDEQSQSDFNNIFKSACTFMTILLNRVAQTNTDQNALLSQQVTPDDLPKFVQNLLQCCLKHEDLHVIVFGIETFLGLITKEECGIDPRIQQYIIRNIHGFDHLEKITTRLWDLLVPECALIHFEAVKLLVEIHNLNRKLCNTIISDYMLHKNLQIRVESHRRFALIWRLIDDLSIDQRVFDAGMFLMLDSIKSDDSNLRLIGRSWLMSSFRNMYRILDPLFQTLVDQEYASRINNSTIPSVDNLTGDTVSSKRKPHSKMINNARSPYDQERCKYVLSIWNAMLHIAPRNFIQRTMELKLTEDVQNNFLRYVGKSFYPLAPDQKVQPPSYLFTYDHNDYFSLIVTTCVQFMECGVSMEPRAADHPKIKTVLSEKTVLEETIRTKSIVFLRDILMNGRILRRSYDFAQALVECVLAHLRNAVENNDAVFQVEILGMLHTLLSHLHSYSTHIHHNRDGSSNERYTAQTDGSNSPVVVLVHSPNFLPTLLQGILVANEAQVNSAFYSYSLLNYWVEYATSFLPFLETALPYVVSAIVPHFCNIIRDNALSGVDSLRAQAIQKLLEGLKRILTYGVLEFKQTTTENDSNDITNEDHSSSTQSSSTVALPFHFITNLVKEVFTSEEATIKNEVVSPALENQQFLLSELPVMIETITIVWRALRSPYTMSKALTKRNKRSTGTVGLIQYGSLHTKFTIEQGIVHFIDPLLGGYRFHFALALVVLWYNLHPEAKTSIQCEQNDLDGHIIDILNNVDNATPEIIITALVDLISNIRQNKLNKVISVPQPMYIEDSNIGTSDVTGVVEVRKELTNLERNKQTLTKVQEHMVLSFLQVYLRKCILTDKSAEILTKLLQLIRDYLSPANSPNGVAPINTLDILVISMYLKTLQSFIQRWSVQNEDKKLKLKLIDVFHQLVGSGLLCCVREMNNRQTTFNKNMKSSKISVTDKEHMIRLELHDELDPSLQFLRFLSANLVDMLDKIPHEYSSLSNLVNIMSNPITTILKNNTLINLPRIHCAVSLLSVFSPIMLNMKALRKDIWDLFYTPNFFKIQRETIELWRVVLHTLINGGETIEQSLVQNEEEVLLFEQQQIIQKENKALFTDLLNRFSATQSIFTSRDSEALQRANLSKRLAFMLYTGVLDSYASFLPNILEKMADSLKLNPSYTASNILTASILFSLRVLITRISPAHLAPLWPLVITELLKIFSNIETLNDIKVAFESIKFLDFASVVLPQEFQLYKWMFCDQLGETATIHTVFEPYLTQLVNKYGSGVNLSRHQSLTDTVITKRRPIDTRVFSEDWVDVAKLAAYVSSRWREKELYFNSTEQGFDMEFTNHLIASDFSELPPEDYARLISVDFVPTKSNSWIMVSTKSKEKQEQDNSSSSSTSEDTNANASSAPGDQSDEQQGTPDDEDNEENAKIETSSEI